MSAVEIAVHAAALFAGIERLGLYLQNFPVCFFLKALGSTT